MNPAFHLRAGLALMALAAGSPSGFAAPVYWGQTAFSADTTYAGSASTAGNWFTDAAGTSASSGAPDSLGEDLVFNTTPANALGGTVAIDANFSANSLTFNTSGKTILAQDANRNLVLGAGGITLNAASGDVSIGVNANTLNVRLAASQTWANRSANTLAVRNVITQAGVGPVALSLNAAGAGNITLPYRLADTLDEPLSLVIESEGSGAITVAAGTYSGGTTVKRGKLAVSGTNDTGGILLGDTTGTSPAVLTVNSTGFSNAITVRAGSSGGKTLVTSHPAGVLNGPLVLEDTLTLSAAGKLTTLAGEISGAGGLVKEGKGEVVLAGANAFTGNLTVESGALSLAGTGSLTFTVGANGSSNQVTGPGAATFGGTFQFKVPSASRVDGHSWPIVTVSQKSYSPTFAVAGFTQTDDVWTDGAGLTFSESTGVLSYKRLP